MNTSILINATRDGKTVKKTVTNVNPDKSNADLKTFAQMVNNLSNDTFASGNRINVQSLDEQKRKPTNSFTSSFQSFTSDGEYIGHGFTFSTDYPFRIFSNTNSTKYTSAVKTAGDQSLFLLRGWQEGDPQFTIYLFFPESKEFQAFTWDITVG